MSSHASRLTSRCCRHLEATARRYPRDSTLLLQRDFAPVSTPVLRRGGFHSGRRTERPTAPVRPPGTSKVIDAEAVSSATRAPQLDISKDGFADAPPLPGAGAMGSDPSQQPVDWTRSYHGLSAVPFSAEAAGILQAPLDAEDVEIKPDGILYLPEIKYRRILNKAFGPGGWGLAPRGETIVTGKAVTREYALVVLGRLVSVARGEQDYFSPEGIPTAAEGCRSNALLRCCKDLGIASELWDPRFIRDFMKKNIKEVWVEHVVTKKKKKIFIRKDGVVTYPFKETKA